MNDAPLALHPQRKRKFFTNLAHLLGKDPPAIRSLESAFFGPDLPDEYRVVRNACSSPEASSVTPLALLVPSQSLSGESFKSVEFGSPRTKSSGISSLGASQQGSHNESMADSLLFLPNKRNTRTGINLKRQDHGVEYEFETETKPDSASQARNPLPVTTLINNGMLSETPSANVRLELMDYYDADRMCELSPCWLQSDGASCDIHQGTIRRPMLLFCLQALDEFVACNEWLGQQRWRVQACKVARRIFTAMWEVDVLGIAPLERDIVVADCVAMKTAVMGVALDVWRIIARYWDKYKQNYLHGHQELYFTDVSGRGSTHTASKWELVRALLHIYGMKPSQARSLIDQHDSDHLNLWKLTERQLRAATQGLQSIEQLHVGMDYLKCNAAGAASVANEDSAVVRRPLISQQDAKTAFNAILIHLEKWNENVQMFPCGSFSRGAAFISVLDVLVVIPLPEGNSTSADIDTKLFEDVVTALTAANVIQTGAMRRLTTARGACIVSFKNSSILLDLKVYCPPRSWFALLYFTGPEDFVMTFFTVLLKRSLQEIPDTSFECIYSGVTEVLGSKALLSIASERDLFDFIGRDYLQPTDRI